MSELEKLLKDHNRIMRQLVQRLDKSIEASENTVRALQELVEVEKENKND
jgi:nitrate reductase assembly molybdenum cofactor insertion protein NarJ